MRRAALPLVLLLGTVLAGCTGAVRGTGDLGVVVERATGSIQVVETTGMSRLATIDGLGDLSHASVVFARDGRYAYVFGRDGGLSRVDLLRATVTHRVIQAGNSIGGAISQDGRVVAAQNYDPGGIRLFDAATLEPLADIPAITRDGQRSKVVGLADLPGQRLAASLFDAGEIWIIDIADPRKPEVTRLPAGRQPYDALVTPDGRWYLAGLFGEDGLALVDLWQTPPASQRVLSGYGRGTAPLPVYKMPHLRGWAMAQGKAWLPAIGRHEVLIADTANAWRETGRVEVAGQPVFVMARPDGRQVWVNFAFPNNDTVQVIDTAKRQVVRTLKPCRGVLHMEFTPKGEAVWLSCRDDNRVMVYDTASFEPLATLPADHPSGIFFTSRAQRFGM
ncbi:cytochrome D1 domain-containing protein [Cupriavidus sp. BIS7]|uniref:cytochrome D1 domain-containing protein n=1 Tax=Cupriavidus sp. BIS7 TaxID=1217718 RepID=UPI0003673F7F|nr:cytochrome D1 domain-containing protein [Cupriavidus sp. BIS7]